MSDGEIIGTSAVLNPQRRACGERFSTGLSQRVAVADQLRSLTSYGGQRSRRLGSKVGLQSHLDGSAVAQPADPTIFERFEARSKQFEDRYSRLFHPALSRAPNLSMPGSRSSVLPYRSSIGGWRDIGEMVLLRWFQEEGQEIEESAPESRSAWPERSSYVGARVSKNAWLKHRRNTRLSKSRAPQRHSVDTPKSRSERSSSRGLKPLHRTALRAIAVNNSTATQSIRRALSQLPPSVAPSTFRKIAKLHRNANENTSRPSITTTARDAIPLNQQRTAAKKSYSSSPLVSNVADHLQVGQPDAVLTATELAQSRTAGRQQNTPRNYRSAGVPVRKPRGLRPVLSTAPSFQYIDNIDQRDEALEQGAVSAQSPRVSKAFDTSSERRDAPKNLDFSSERRGASGSSLRPTQRAVQQFLSPIDRLLLQSDVFGSESSEIPNRAEKVVERPAAESLMKSSTEPSIAHKSSAFNYARSRHPEVLALKSIRQGSILPSPTPTSALGVPRSIRLPLSNHEFLEQAQSSTMQSQITEITQRKTVLQSLLDSWETSSDERRSSIYTEIVQQRNQIDKLSHRIRRSRLSNPAAVELLPALQPISAEKQELAVSDDTKRQRERPESARISQSPWLSHPSASRPPVREERRNDRKMVFRALQRAMTREAQQSEMNPTRMTTSRPLTSPSLSQLKAVAAASGLTLTEVQLELERASRALISSPRVKTLERRKRSIPTAYVDLAPADIVAPERGDSVPIVREDSTKDTAKDWSSLSNAWSRMLMPQQLPELRSMGTGGRHPLSSPRAWRPSTSYALSPTDLMDHLDQRVEGSEHSAEVFARLEGALFAPRRSALIRPEMKELNPTLPTELSDNDGQDFATPAARQVSSAWQGSAANLSANATGLTSLSQQLKSTYKPAPFSWEQAVGQSAVWVQPQRTAMLEDGTIIDSKTVARLGIRVKTGGSEKSRLPLSWTLEGVAAQSDHRSLPKWAKRASERPQIKGSPELLTALVRASTTEEVLDAILARGSEPSSLRTLPPAATQVIEQIRKEADTVAHRELTSRDSETITSRNMGLLGRLKQQDIASSRLSHSGRPVRRSSQVMREFTGLRPLATAHSESAESENASGTDKLAKLSKQLENLVLLAENQQRDEARMGVRMAEDKESAIDEGQGAQQQIQEAPDSQLDIDALRQEVLNAFEMEKSLRKIRSHSDDNNADFWW